MTNATINRFLSKLRVNPVSGCWEWVAGKDTHGYGQMKIGGRKRLAHRLSYELYRTPIPDGMCVLHVCDNPACVYPDHLFLGTHTDNMADMMSKGRGHKAPPKGSAHGCAKLSEKEVVEIKSAVGRTNKELAAQYGVSRAQIGLIRQGKRWAHIEVAS